MHAMPNAYMNGNGGSARVRGFCSPASFVAVPASWLLVAAIDHKTGTGARRLGVSPP